MDQETLDEIQKRQRIGILILFGVLCIILIVLTLTQPVEQTMQEDQKAGSTETLLP